ncbi:MAG: L,D-transpeptidase family protein [Chloroflexota bacterium]|nr:L,D-transpeptidase family protein [Chloroflexota bacterium]
MGQARTANDLPNVVDWRLSRRRLLVTGAAVGSGALLGEATGLSLARAQSGQIVPVSNARYFAETGHNLREPFLSRWEAAGGAAVLGLPLSEERYVEGSGGVVQTFEAITLVYDPTQEAPLNIQAQSLSESARADLATPSASRTVRGCVTSGQAICRFFPESGHTLSGAIGAFWAERGNLAFFGLPVSEPVTDRATGITSQVFENVVIEDHGGGDVRPRKLGDALIAEQSGDGSFAPAPPNGGTTSLINASDGLRLRSGPSFDAETIVLLPDNAEFIAAPGSHTEWVPGYVDGYAGWVSSDFLVEPPAVPTLSLKEWDPKVWQGAALGDTNVRSEPSTKSRTVKELTYRDPVTVTAWVKGEEVFEGANLWARLAEGQFIYARNIARVAPVLPPPVPADAPGLGAWIDVNLTQQLMVAYDGRTPLRVAVTTTGMAGWETPPGYYTVLWRVANETMTSGAIGAEHFYKLEDVLFTQYFTERGHAIHFAWWRTPETIGRPGSHGCLNLLLDDARFFWDWATIGTPVYVHP